METKKVDKKIKQHIRILYGAGDMSRRYGKKSIRRKYSSADGILEITYQGKTDPYEKIDFMKGIRTTYMPKQTFHTDPTKHKWHKIGPFIFKSTKTKKLSLEDKVGFEKLLQEATHDFCTKAIDQKEYWQGKERKSER